MGHVLEHQASNRLTRRLSPTFKGKVPKSEDGCCKTGLKEGRLVGRKSARSGRNQIVYVLLLGMLGGNIPEKRTRESHDQVRKADDKKIVMSQMLKTKKLKLFGDKSSLTHPWRWIVVGVAIAEGGTRSHASPF